MGINESELGYKEEAGWKGETEADVGEGEERCWEGGGEEVNWSVDDKVGGLGSVVIGVSVVNPPLAKRLLPPTESGSVFPVSFWCPLARMVLETDTGFEKEVDSVGGEEGEGEKWWGWAWEWEWGWGCNLWDGEVAPAPPSFSSSSSAPAILWAWMPVRLTWLCPLYWFCSSSNESDEAKVTSDGYMNA